MGQQAVRIRFKIKDESLQHLSRFLQNPKVVIWIVIKDDMGSFLDFIIAFRSNSTTAFPSAANMKSIQHITVIFNEKKSGAPECLETVLATAQSIGLTITSFLHTIEREKIFLPTDLILTIGGDGTFLSMADFAHTHDLPILGINNGRLGFLTTFTLPIEEGLRRLHDGHYHISSRTILDGHCEDMHFSSLNDIVIKSIHPTHLVDLYASTDGQMINEYSADGLIIATPTGSTAYNLSARGPLLHPHMDAILLTAISPHSLSDRSLVLPASTQLTISWPPEQILIAHDGWMIDIPAHADSLSITRSPKTLSMVDFSNTNFFDLLRNKLHLRGRVR
jgi:NAD+ kinase